MPSAPDNPATYQLFWHKSDPEARLGLRAGRFTEANSAFAAFAAGLLTVATLAGIFALHLILGYSFLYNIFVQHGWVPMAILFFFYWSIIIIFIKTLKLGVQRRVLSVAILPQDANFTLTTQSSAVALERIEAIADSPAQYILLNRLKVALLGLRNLGQVSEMIAMLETQARNDEDAVGSSFQLLAGFIWAMPVLGFIGTVQGLSQAIGGFGLTLAKSADFQGVQDALIVVVSGLSISFDTTLLGLIAAVVLQLTATVIKQRELRFLDECKEYCQKYIIVRLRLK